MSRRRIETNSIVTEEMTNRMSVISERVFASAFLRWFGRKQPLIFQPPPIEVEGIGTTAPDFFTQSSLLRLFFEVTQTKNTFDDDRKPIQYKVMKAHRLVVPDDHHLEVNGGALQCLGFLMDTIQSVLGERIQVYKAQKLINQAGIDPDFRKRMKQTFD